MNKTENYDVLIVGAGPSGTCAAALLNKKGYRVAILEKELFPRFSIGESLLPQSMVYLENAGLLEDIRKVGFQKKDGAVFLANGELSVFEFADKYTDGPYETFQVQRAIFDKTMADTCERMGVDIYYQHSVNKLDFTADDVRIETVDLKPQETKEFTGKFVLDASGFGRTLPRLLKLDKPTNFPNRRAIFGHMKTKFPDDFDVNKILVTVDEQDSDVWLWTIPFSKTSCSIGVVGTEKYFESYGDKSNEEILLETINRSPKLKEFMAGSQFTTEIRTLKGYACDVTSLYCDRFALLGNAGEFLDPVFSSGVTIALHSASLAAEVLDKELKGQKPNWEVEFSEKLKAGVKCFKTFVSTWYTGELQTIIFYPKPQPRIKKMICSVLAGYAWDKTNPYVAESDRAVSALASACRPE